MMAKQLRSLLRGLRSPRLAVWFVLGVAAYAVVGTVFPQGAQDSPRVAAWVTAHPAAAAIARPLGLFSAFGSPLFLSAMGLLALSTAVCAWNRTRVARRLTAPGHVGAGLRGVLASRPMIVAGPIGVGASDTALKAATAALGARGFRVRVDGDVVSADKTPWGAWASPLFHWSLVALFVIVAAGQLSRAEGRLVIPVDGSVADETGSYGGAVSAGPLYRGHSGLEFRAYDLTMSTVVDGVERGDSAVVGLYRGDTVLAKQRVYPNAPLRYGNLLVHPGTWGYAPLLAVETTSGQQGASAYAMLDSSKVTASGAGPGELSLSGGPVEGTIVRVLIPVERMDSAGKPVLSRAVAVTVTRAGGVPSAPVVVVEGGRVPLFDGLWLRFVKRGMYFSVRVADDWSVPWIYALFIGASLALVFAVFFPPRRVWLMVVEDGGGARIHAITREQRGAPGFPDRVASILSEALPDDVEVRVVCS